MPPQLRYRVHDVDRMAGDVLVILGLIASKAVSLALGEGASREIIPSVSTITLADNV